MPHFKLTLAYDGTDFVGWQRQAVGTSIQGLLEDALAELNGSAVSIVGAGRTDAGVHALGQVASVLLDRDTDPGTVVRALNARLPAAVRVLEAQEVAPDFHARFTARSKTYCYRIWNCEVLSPFERPYVWHVPSPELDIDAMIQAAARLEGRHDFAAFRATGVETRTTERVVLSSRVVRAEGFEDRQQLLLASDRDATPPSGRSRRAAADPPRRSLITYEICGDGFLRRMVRAIVGSLVEVGRGRHPESWITEVLASKARGRAGPTAPAAGLFLVRVDYQAPDL